jgi:hypothetical protein
VGLIAKEVMFEGLYKMIELILMSLLKITQIWMMMTISLYLWAKETGLGLIKQEGM